MNFLGLYREPDYSPGRHLSNDAKILQLVADALEREGVRVTLVTLDEARPIYAQADLIFSMCQGPQALKELTAWKKDGAWIVNDPEAARRTYRDSLCSTLREKELGFPHSFFVSTDVGVPLEGCEAIFNGGSAWLKRTDVHATQTEDVVHVPSFDALVAALAAFRKRGLSTAVVQQHREGDEVKFYGVRGGHLFWPFYPKESHGYPFSEKALGLLVDQAAEALGLSVYGGDAIISAEGQITLIDINDWPSFAPCRGAAAHAIAAHLMEIFRAHPQPLART